jgi:hypothetical protein
MPRSSDNSTSWSGSHFILPRLDLHRVRRVKSQNTLFILLSLMRNSPSQHLDSFQHRSPRLDAREPHHPLVHRLAHSLHFTNPRKSFSLFFALDLTEILLNSWYFQPPIESTKPSCLPHSNPRQPRASPAHRVPLSSTSSPKRNSSLIVSLLTSQLNPRLY